MPDVAHYPNEDCTCESGSDEVCEYRLLADAVIAALHPHDGDEAEVSLLVRAVEDAATRITELEVLARDMLSRFTRTGDGYPDRAGQLQIARWEKQLGGDGGE